MNKKVNIGKEIKLKRLSLNMTMDYVAKNSGITRATLSSIENGSTKCSLTNFLKVINFLDMELIVKSNNNLENNRLRATRINTLLNKKINRFIIMCIEEYAKSVNKRSDVVYDKMIQKGVIDEFTNDYEDLHGMSTEYLNNYIEDLLNK